MSENRWDSTAPIRYPDPDIVVLDPRFQKIVLGNAGIRRIATGFDFTEGPVWFGDGRYLLFSDIPNDKILRWDETTDGISVFRSPSHYANGNTRDRQGRLITCEHDTQRLTRTEYDGTVVVLAHQWEGKKLTGPNDVVVKSDGTIWFSDKRSRHPRQLSGPHRAAGASVSGVSAGPAYRHHDDCRRRHGSAERPVLLTGRNETLRRRYPGRSAEKHLGIRHRRSRNTGGGWARVLRW